MVMCARHADNALVRDRIDWMMLNGVAEQTACTATVHRLCYKSFFLAPLWISPDLLAIPITAPGFDAELGYVANFVWQFSGSKCVPKKCALEGHEGSRPYR